MCKSAKKGSWLDWNEAEDQVKNKVFLKLKQEGNLYNPQMVDSHRLNLSVPLHISS